MRSGDFVATHLWKLHLHTLRPCAGVGEDKDSGAGELARGLAAARPSPSHFQKFTARPGPAHQIFESLGPARPGPSQFSDRPGPARPRQTAHDKPWYLRLYFEVCMCDMYDEYISSQTTRPGFLFDNVILCDSSILPTVTVLHECTPK